MKTATSSGSRSLRLALLGCGRIGQEVYLPLLGQRSDVRIGVIADASAAARSRAAATTGNSVPIVEDWREALVRDDIDGAIGDGEKVIAELRDRVAAGAVGRVRAIRTVLSSPRIEAGGWCESRAAGGGVLLELGSHHADLIRWVTSAEARAQARLQASSSRMP